jgi:TPR repeat protein
MAQYNLAMMYGQGKGLAQSDAEAAKWFRKAADQGNAPAQVNLSLLYFTGKGLPQDSTQAYLWCSLAANAGDRNAAALLDKISQQMTPRQITQVKEEIRNWRPTRPTP